MLPPSDPAIRLRALRELTPSKRGVEENTELANLEQQVSTEALQRFEQLSKDRLADDMAEVLFNEPDYEAERQAMDQLQIDLTSEVTSGYISLTEMQPLLVKSSGHRVIVNTMFRRARRYADVCASALDRLERLWAHCSPADVEWQSKALAAQVMDPHRARANRSARHAQYAEAAYWGLQRTSQEIEMFIRLYDLGGGATAPVGTPQHTGGQ